MKTEILDNKGAERATNKTIMRVALYNNNLITCRFYWPGSPTGSSTGTG